MSRNLIKHASILITLTTAILYAVGHTFYQSYLSSLGVAETQFQLSIDRTIFYGFVSSVNMGGKALLWLYATAAGVVILTLIGKVIFEFIRNHKLAVAIKNFRIKNLHSENSRSYELVDFSIRVFEYSTASLIIFLGCLVVFLLSDKVGRESAINFKKNCAEHKIPSHVIYLADRSKIAGCTVICSSENCAYFHDNRVTVVGDEGRVVSETQVNP